jgi:hypothetical protein
VKAAATAPAPLSNQAQIEAEAQRIVAQTLPNAQQPIVRPGGTRRTSGLAPQPAASSENPDGANTKAVVRSNRTTAFFHSTKQKTKCSMLAFLALSFTVLAVVG